MNERPFAVTNASGLQLRGTLRDNGNRNFVLFVHGFRSDCQGTKARFLSDWTNAAAVDFSCVELSGHGHSDGNFRDFRLSSLLSDLETIIAALDRRLILVGSSMGGWLAVLAAQRHPERVQGLLLLAPGFNFIQNHFGALPTHILAAWKAAGRRNFESDYGLGRYELDYRVIADARAFDVLTHPQSVSCPCFIVHGQNDKEVPVAVSERFLERLEAPTKALYVVPNGDHRLHESFDLIARLLHDLLR